MILDWYLCPECSFSIELEEGKHGNQPKCPACGKILCYQSSSETISDDDLDERSECWKDPNKINYDVKEARIKAEEHTEEALRNYIQQNAPKCPTCGSTDLERIGTLDRMFSVGFFGLASGKIGKQFKCRNCKYMW